jgi:hypothetical protein
VTPFPSHEQSRKAKMADWVDVCATGAIDEEDTPARSLSTRGLLERAREDRPLGRKIRAAQRTAVCLDFDALSGQGSRATTSSSRSDALAG